MGSLFSSNEKTDIRPSTHQQPSYEQKPAARTIPEYAPRKSSQIYQPSSINRYDYIDNMYYLQQRYYLQQKVNADIKLYDYLLKANSWPELEGRTTFRLECLNFNSSTYAKINALFKKTTQRHFMIQNIYEVQNPFLYGFYLLKKEEMIKRFGIVEELLLFHGTKSENISNILENNLNWRLYGQSRGNIFGQGVSFTPISCYASNYSDKFKDVKVMIVAKVLVSNETIGYKNMQIPPLLDQHSRYRYDTSIKPNGQVYVKYSDNEFYPNYVIYYTGEQIKTVKY